MKITTQDDFRYDLPDDEAPVAPPAKQKEPTKREKKEKEYRGMIAPPKQEEFKTFPPEVLRKRALEVVEWLKGHRKEVELMLGKYHWFEYLGELHVGEFFDRIVAKGGNPLEIKSLWHLKVSLHR